MLFSIVNGKKTEASPNMRGICPLCNNEVLSKCGEINVWHWAHINDQNCDDWHEPETAWHKNWKLVFGKENCEVVISKNNKRHIADIETNEGVIIELQNSPIKYQVIETREEFYGERMIWIINGSHFNKNFILPFARLMEDNDYYNTHYPPAKNEKSINYYRKDLIDFTWKRPRKSWEAARRDVFIDLGKEKLFQIKEGIGQSNGTGSYYDKKEFIIKHGGNIDLLPSVIY